jgi:hypothetical protein
MLLVFYRPRSHGGQFLPARSRRPIQAVLTLTLLLSDSACAPIIIPMLKNSCPTLASTEALSKRCPSMRHDGDPGIDQVKELIKCFAWRLAGQPIKRFDNQNRADGDSTGFDAGEEATQGALIWCFP